MRRRTTNQKTSDTEQVTGKTMMNRWMLGVTVLAFSVAGCGAALLTYALRPNCVSATAPKPIEVITTPRSPSSQPPVKIPNNPRTKVRRNVPITAFFARLCSLRRNNRSPNQVPAATQPIAMAATKANKMSKMMGKPSSPMQTIISTAEMTANIATTMGTAIAVRNPTAH